MCQTPTGKGLFFGEPGIGRFTRLQPAFETPYPVTIDIANDTIWMAADHRGIYFLPLNKTNPAEQEPIFSASPNPNNSSSLESPSPPTNSPIKPSYSAPSILLVPSSRAAATAQQPMGSAAGRLVPELYFVQLRGDFGSRGLRYVVGR